MISGFVAIIVKLDGAIMQWVLELAVLPKDRRQGADSELVCEGLREYQRAGWSVIVVLGHPEYYPHFAFIPASLEGLRCEWSVPDKVFIVAE